MLVAEISYFNRYSNIGAENNQSKHQSSKSKLTENFGHDRDKRLGNGNSNLLKGVARSVSSIFTQDKAEKTQSRCLSIIG